MVDTFKVGLLERNGVELDFQEEKLINAATLPYDSSGVRSIADQMVLNAGLPRVPVTCVMNSNMSNGDWVVYSNLTPDSRVIVPVKSMLQEVTWSNSRTSVDFDLTFRRNGRSSSIFHTEVFRDLDYGGVFNPTSQSFNKGDFIDVQYIDQGTNCSDLVVVYTFQAVE